VSKVLFESMVEGESCISVATGRGCSVVGICLDPFRR